MEEKGLSYIGTVALEVIGEKVIDILADDVSPVATEVVIPSPS